MLRIARHAMLFLCVVALLAVMYILYSSHALDVVEMVQIRPTVVSADLPKATDPAKLREFCFLLGKAWDEAALQRRKEFDDFVHLMRRWLGIALAFSTASVVVLMLGWVAAGRTMRKE